MMSPLLLIRSSVPTCRTIFVSLLCGFIFPPWTTKNRAVHLFSSGWWSQDWMRERRERCQQLFRRTTGAFFFFLVFLFRLGIPGRRIARGERFARSLVNRIDRKIGRAHVC